MTKLFVRERRHVGQGAGRPRFAVVAAQGVDLHIYLPRVRRLELEKMAAETGAEIVYLPRGEQETDESTPRRRSGRRRQRRSPSTE